MASNALALLERDTLRLRGVLDRAAVIALWPQLQALPAKLARLDLAEVERVDSAGLA
uniref:STAS domain-containing protein n=1 Tax=Enterobacter hormaechei TaxID=158836 RepID=UPI0035A265F2